MADKFTSFPTVADSPALDAFTITPSGTDLAVIPRALYIGVAGDITIITHAGTTLTMTVSAGVLPLVVRRVSAATATGIVGLV